MNRPSMTTGFAKYTKATEHQAFLSDPMTEGALYDSLSMRAFAGSDLGMPPVPDETTLRRLRHLLGRHGLGRKPFTQMHQYLQRRGFKPGTSTIVDAPPHQCPVLDHELPRTPRCCGKRFAVNLIRAPPETNHRSTLPSGLIQGSTDGREKKLQYATCSNLYFGRYYHAGA
ncbi:MAG: transposase [Pseudomonadota bacterium]